MNYKIMIGLLHYYIISLILISCCILINILVICLVKFLENTDTIYIFI
jgi:hypothetical protein